MNNTTDFRFRWTLSAGLASASSVATKTYAPAQSSSQRHRSNKVYPLSSLRGLQLKLSRWSRYLPLQSI